ncbi:MAG TPA: hypothetical protein VJA94_14280 [Candidatus Angelobacter sp.]
MRRVFASALIVVLVASLSLPVWATACAHMAKTPMCHRAPAQHHSHPTARKDGARWGPHHCDGMGDENEMAVPNSDRRVSDLPAKCPMQCCMQATVSKVAVAVKNAIVFHPITSHERVERPGILFTSNGFSSHTDRGPPAA